MATRRTFGLGAALGSLGLGIPFAPKVAERIAPAPPMVEPTPPSPQYEGLSYGSPSFIPAIWLDEFKRALKHYAPHRVNEKWVLHSQYIILEAGWGVLIENGREYVAVIYEDLLAMQVKPALRRDAVTKWAQAVARGATQRIVRGNTLTWQVSA